MTNAEQKAKREGARAWLNEVSLKACPYVESRLRTAWRDGWIERDAGQQFDPE